MPAAFDSYCDELSHVLRDVHSRSFEIDAALLSYCVAVQVLCAWHCRSEDAEGATVCHCDEVHVVSALHIRSEVAVYPPDSH